MECWKCGESVEVGEKIQRKDACPHCGVDLRCCYNCNFYDKEAYHHCKEPQAEWVRYKERGNFCEFFTPKRPFLKMEEKLPEKEDLKKKWNSLFMDEPEKT
jgi:beta-glucanase (GH16 family)